MASNDQEDLRARFTEITGVEGDRSKFYLEASGWNLDTAVASFYEAGHDQDDLAGALDEGMDADDELQGAADSTRPSGSLISALLSGTGSREGLMPQDFPQSVQDDGSRYRRAHAPRTGQPVTLDSLRNQPTDESSDDDRQGQAFYAGGSESSGQQVLGPPKKREELVAEMFRKAREMGAEERPAGIAAAKKKESSTFAGTGYKLGENTEDTVVIPSVDSSRQGGGVSREFILRLWSNGFTVNDGPLRDYHDPANVEFLDTIKRREIPAELQKAARGQEVELAMEDRRREEYAPPKAVARPFSGRGQMLGSPAPATIGSTAAASEDDRKANESAAQNQVKLEDGEPTTNITFRLVDGSRLQARFNHTHTVEDLYQFVNAARPQMASASYVLTFFPNKELNERSSTVKDANVLNAMITQKMKN